MHDMILSIPLKRSKKKSILVMTPTYTVPQSHESEEKEKIRDDGDIWS